MEKSDKAVINLKNADPYEGYDDDEFVALVAKTLDGCFQRGVRRGIQTGLRERLREC